MRTLIPVLIGVGVMIYLFGFALTFSDTEQSAQVVAVDLEQQAAEVKLSEGGKTRLPWSALPEMTLAESAGGFAGIEASAIGEQVTVARAGLISQFKRLQFGLLAAVLGLIGAVLSLQAMRLMVLSRAMGHALSFGQAARGMVIGLFYGNVIPAGQVGGDPIKAVYLARMAHTSGSSMMALVFIDRVLGLLAIVLLAGLALVPHIGDARYQLAALAITAVLAVGGCAMLLILSRRLRRLSGLDWLVSKLPGSPVERFVAAFSSVRGHPSALLLSLAISVVAQIGLGVCALLTGIFIGIPFEQAGVLDYLGTVPVINVVTSVPGAPPGGWGFGEGAYMLFFGVYGVLAEQAVMLSIVPRLGLLAFSLLGLPAIISARRALGVKKSAHMSSASGAMQALAEDRDEDGEPGKAREPREAGASPSQDEA